MSLVGLKPSFKSPGAHRQPVPAVAGIFRTSSLKQESPTILARHSCGVLHIIWLEFRFTTYYCDSCRRANPASEVSILEADVLSCSIRCRRESVETRTSHSSFFPHVWQPMLLSKMTAATLEEIEYIVDSSMVRFEPQYAVVSWNVRRRPSMVAIKLPRETTPRHFTAGPHLSVKTFRGTSRRNTVVRRVHPMHMMCYSPG